MRDAGVERALVFVTSAFSSYSGCRQYREDLERATAAVPDAPHLDKIRVFFNHPGFIRPMADSTRDAIQRLAPELRDDPLVLFSAHSIPLSMARGCAYEAQLAEAARLVAERAGVSRYRAVYQSRSGPPQVPWLEPDVCDVITEAAEAGERAVVVVPIGFISDHLEVLFDLDREARDRAHAAGLAFERSATVGTDPRFVAMIRELIQERLTPSRERLALGCLGPSHDVCPLDCCLSGVRRPAQVEAAT
jgi:ferrochelatase